MRVVAVIPVKGRLPLLKYTIQRLYNKNGVYKVICVGQDFDEKLCAEYNGAEFVSYPNNPLGKKWNAGFKAARKHRPDAVLFVGSSDWISDNWIPFLAPYLDRYDMIGKPDFSLLDIGETYRFCQWPGYGKGPREDEPIGIGRLLSARILDKLNWRPIKDELNSSIDFSMFKNVIGAGGKVLSLKSPEIDSLSISTSRWPNMHKFEDHWTNKLVSHRRPDYLVWLEKRFPEFKLVFNED